MVCYNFAMVNFHSLIDYFTGHFLPAVGHTIFLLSPIWVPALLVVFLFRLWMLYIQTDFINKQATTLLEIKLPKEIDKSPLAMEVILAALYQSGNSTLIEKYFGGKVRPWFSLELVSIEGQVHFFLWTWARYKNIIEAQIYAQYPTVEIYEVPDYTLSVPHDPVGHPMWACEFKLTKPDPYPIKTYVDYGLHMNPKEEYKVDPIASMLEFLGSVGKGEQVWIQIVIQAHRKEKLKDGAIFERVDWTEDAKNEVKKIVEDAEVATSDEKVRTTLNLSQAQTDTINAIERSLNKFAFDTGIRGLYVAEKESFNGATIPALIGSFRQFSSQTLNGFKLAKVSDFEYPWQDFMRMRRNVLEQEMLSAFKKRGFFHSPHTRERFVLNTEEIATLYHFPGNVAQTPTFDRISSKKAEAPFNLPI
jgi:hypothetical protein